MYCVACRQGFARSLDKLQHLWDDGTHHSWCAKQAGRDVALEMGGKRPRLDSKPLDFSVAPGRERIMRVHRVNRAAYRGRERKLNPPPPVQVVLTLGRIKLVK